MASLFWTVGALSGASSVMAGAFGAHALKSRIADPSKIANWSTAAQYQLIHSGMVMLTAAAAPHNKLAMGL